MASPREENRYAASLEEARQRAAQQAAEEDESENDPIDRPQKQKREPKIGVLAALCMGVLAIIFDLLSLIPIVDWVTLVIAALTYGVWLLLLGFRWSDPIDKKILGWLFGAEIFEFIPLVNMLPGWIAFVVVAYVIDNYSEKIASAVPGGEQALEAIKKI